MEKPEFKKKDNPLKHIQECVEHANETREAECIQECSELRKTDPNAPELRHTEDCLINAATNGADCCTDKCMEERCKRDEENTKKIDEIIESTIDNIGVVDRWLKTGACNVDKTHAHKMQIAAHNLLLLSDIVLLCKAEEEKECMECDGDCENCDECHDEDEDNEMPDPELN